METDEAEVSGVWEKKGPGARKQIDGRVFT